MVNWNKNKKLLILLISAPIIGAVLFISALTVAIKFAGTIIIISAFAIYLKYFHKEDENNE